MTIRIRVLIVCAAASALASCGDPKSREAATSRTDDTGQTGRKTPPPLPLKLDPGSPDERLQTAIEGLPNEVRMNAVALAACRSMRDGEASTTEARISGIRQAAADVTADPSAASACMRAISARTAPPPTRRN